jgi:hypothetical protein
MPLDRSLELRRYPAQFTPGPSNPAEPTFSRSTEVLWERLPAYYRDADATNNWTFKRWLSAMTDRLGDVMDLLARIDYIPLNESLASGAMTGEDTTVQASVMALDGPWTNDGTEITTATGPAEADTTVYLLGGVYAFSMNYGVGPNFGQFDVFVDDQLLRRVDGYASAASIAHFDLGQVNLSRGYHNLRISWSSALNSSSTDTVVSIQTLRFINQQAASQATSALANPEAANPEWLQWMSQLLVSPQYPNLTPGELRNALQNKLGRNAGTRQSIKDAAATALTGAKFVNVYDHSKVGLIGSESEWDILVTTRSTETPSVNDVLDAIIRHKVKPAGVLIQVGYFSATWGRIEAAYPTWGDWRAAGSWRVIEEAGLTSDVDNPDDSNVVDDTFDDTF